MAWRRAARGRDLGQLALERPGAGEQPAIERIERVARREEHEPAGHANGDADRAAVELDQESLVHLNVSNAPGARPRWRELRRGIGLAGLGCARRSLATCCSLEGPRLCPTREHAEGPGR